MSFLAIVGGLLILAQGALDVANIVPVSPPDFVRPYLTIVGIVSIVAGLVTMYAGWLISRGRRNWGVPSRSSSPSSVSPAAGDSSSAWSSDSSAA